MRYERERTGYMQNKTHYREVNNEEQCNKEQCNKEQSDKEQCIKEQSDKEQKWTLDDYYRLYRETDREAADFYYQLYSGKEYGKQIFVPAKDRQEALAQKLEQIAVHICSLPEPEPQFGVVKRHLQDFVQDLAWKLKVLYTDPSEALMSFLWGYASLDEDMRPEEDKVGDMIETYRQVDAVLEGIRGWYENAPAGYLESCANVLGPVADDLRSFRRDNTELEAVFAHAADSMSVFAEECRAISVKQTKSENENKAAKVRENNTAETAEDKTPAAEENKADIAKNNPAGRMQDDDRVIRMEPEDYRALLRDHLGVDLDALLDWGEEEMEKTRLECFRIAEDIAKEKNEPIPSSMNEVNDLLLKYAGPCDTAEEMFERAGGYLKKTRALAYEYVTMPEEEHCILSEVPYKLRYSYPWGGYSNGDPDYRPLTGHFFLNQYNLSAVTDGWMKINCLHEAYPGHHVQFVRTSADPLPETMKIGAKYIPMLEGTAHRTEKAFGFVYGDDPFYELFAAYRRHHTAVRIQADLMLRFYGRPIKEAVALYEKELGFDHKTARGQVQAQEEMPGYFTCYYYGMKTLCDWEKFYGYSLKEYTELLFSLCHVSLETFHAILELNDEQKKALFVNFESMYREEKQSGKNR